MKKILHIRASNFYGGPEKQLHNHALSAKKYGHDIVFSSFSENDSSPEFLNIFSDDSIKTHLFQVNSAYDFTAVRLVREYILNNNIEILCTHDYRTHFYGRLALKKTKAKWIAFSRGWTKDDLKVRLYNIFDRYNIRYADHIIAVSKAQKDKLIKLNIPDEKISVVYNAVDIDKLKSTASINLRDRFELPSDSILIASAGRFSNEKGQMDLIGAADIAYKKNNSLRFILFGDGPDYSKALNLIDKLGLKNIVFCPGFEKNLSGYLQTADLIVNPSHSEGLPNIVLEAMALKLPVIATSVGGVPELIEDNVSGFLCPPSNSKLLADKILKLSSDGSLMNSFRESAYRTVEEKFSFESQYESLQKIYNKFQNNNNEANN